MELVGFCRARKGFLPETVESRSVANTSFVLIDAMASYARNSAISNPECRRRVEQNAFVGIALLTECYYNRIRASVTVL
jgi:hypothetical protein